MTGIAVTSLTLRMLAKPKTGGEMTIHATKTSIDHDPDPRHRPRKQLLGAPHIARTAIESESEIRNLATARRIVLAAIAAAAEAVIVMANPLVWG